MVTFLIVELGELLKATNSITEKTLKNPRRIEAIGATNPLIGTFDELGTICVDQRSKEEVNRITTNKKVRTAASTAESESAAIASTAAATDEVHHEPVVSTTTGVAWTPEVPVAPQKRKVSETSFGSRSTHTTPTKFLAPEPRIQSLQDYFVRELLRSLGDRSITWARDRDMLIDYAPSVPCANSPDSRTCELSFLCWFEDNDTKVPDRIVAIADGALRMITDKPGRPEEYLKWSKQEACMLFEVLFSCPDG